MLLRARLWTIALVASLLCAVGWIFLPGECVVRPAGTSDSALAGSVFWTFLHPFSFDGVYILYVLLKLSPIGIGVLAWFHWRRRFERLRGLTALYALALSAAVALHPYRTFSDAQLIAIVGVWGVVVLVAHESKASPGAALLALMSIQLLISEVYSGLGADRGLPFWVFLASLVIIFAYGIFHYTRQLRHSVLGRFTEMRRISPAAMARRAALMDQQRGPQPKD
jgi:uncharacterized membrane protein